MINQTNTSKVLLVNKPKGWTSFDVVKKIRSIMKQKYDREQEILDNKHKSEEQNSGGSGCLFIFILLMILGFVIYLVSVY